MRCIFVFVPFLLIMSACGKEEEGLYTGQQLEYLLYSATSEYAYEGKVLFKEMVTGELEVTVQLFGDKREQAYFFPAHLHYESYDAPNAPMAAMLNPVDIRTLKSVSVIRQLARGENLSFNQLPDFDGHVKVHLAEDGPDYKVILVAGNIGSNDNAELINRESISVCAPY